MLNVLCVWKNKSDQIGVERVDDKSENQRVES